MTRSHFLSDTSTLVFDSAAVAILLDSRGRYLLQRRDDIPCIWYPGHWGFFGGAIEPGEGTSEALTRELREEIGLDLSAARFTPFLSYDFEMAWLGGKRCMRHFFLAELTPEEIVHLVLGEGAEMRWVTGDEALKTLPLTPYDSFGLFLHHARERVR
ncbi:MAG: NUDIX domain-containing protein [Alphaproteobacteria bacterium]|nr:NUDIX domain-containing protein [Alphaproteobacteria bacterium]